MSEISDKILEFLVRVNNVNIFRTDSNGKKTKYKLIKLEEELDMFMISSGQHSQSGFDGENSSQSYYFETEQFLPAIEELRTKGYATIDLNGFHVVEKDSWDHSYASPEDEGYASVQIGYVKGRLKLENHVFVEYDLNFTPEEPKIESKSDDGPISKEEIIEMISSHS
ncbi:hypothetical protein CL618_01315 [archaeon]|nr:hypothetical protein [archaeon]|tara:strand:+ start:354 stop:857 length:504 start_codon:yes stop_codon:yes gene_type:complete